MSPPLGGLISVCWLAPAGWGQVPTDLGWLALSAAVFIAGLTTTVQLLFQADQFDSVYGASIQRVIHAFEEEFDKTELGARMGGLRGPWGRKLIYSVTNPPADVDHRLGGLIHWSFLVRRGRQLLRRTGIYVLAATLSFTLLFLLIWLGLYASLLGEIVATSLLIAGLLSLFAIGRLLLTYIRLTTRIDDSITRLSLRLPEFAPLPITPHISLAEPFMRDHGFASTGVAAMVDPIFQDPSGMLRESVLRIIDGSAGGEFSADEVLTALDAAGSPKLGEVRLQLDWLAAHGEIHASFSSPPSVPMYRSVNKPRM